MAAAFNVLWHDDEHVDRRGRGPGPLQRWLHALAAELGFSLACTGTLEKLSASLADTDLHWDALIVDMLWAHEPARTFAALGFELEPLRGLVAGAQLVGLLRGEVFDADRPKWLRPLRTLPVAVFSSAPASMGVVSQYVGSARHEGVIALVKAVVFHDDVLSIAPEVDQAMRRFLVAADPRRASALTS